MFDTRVILTTLSALLLLPACRPDDRQTERQMDALEQRIAKLEAQLDEKAARKEERPALKPSSELPVYPTKWPADGTDADDPYLGSPTAPFLIMVFMDYRSARYRSFARETLPRLKEKYADGGTAKIVLRDFPLPSHAGADKLACLANCAGEQGMYWQAHDSLLFFEGVAPDTSPETFAARLGGLNARKLKECLERGRFRRDLEDDRASGKKLNVAGVPAILIAPNTGRAAEATMIRGAQPFAIIDREMKSLRRKG
jgi:protein-disulfide isomerase